MKSSTTAINLNLNRPSTSTSFTAQQWLQLFFSACGHHLEDVPMLLDLRPTADFTLRHFRHSTHFDGLSGVGGLENRTNELPPPHQQATMGILSSSSTDLNTAVDLLSAKGYNDIKPLHYDSLPDLPLSLSSSSYGEDGHVSRPLWQPAPALVDMFPSILAHLPQDERTVVDVGAGSGRDASWLAYHGFKVTAVERQEKLIRKAVNLFEYKPYHLYHQKNNSLGQPYRPGGCVRGITRTLGADLADDARFFSTHAASVLIVVRFLRQGVVQQLHHAVRPGGFVIYEHFLRGCERFASGPRKPSQMLLPKQLWEFFPPEKGFTVWKDEETTLSDGRPITRFIARRDKPLAS